MDRWKIEALFPRFVWIRHVWITVFVGELWNVPRSETFVDSVRVPTSRHMTNGRVTVEP